MGLPARLSVLVPALLLVAHAACTTDDPPADPSTSPDASAADAATAEDASTASTGDAATDAAADASEPGAGTIGAGPYAAAYSASDGVGIDQRPSVTATFAGSGLEGYTASADEAPLRGTNQIGEVYMDTFAALGRWNGGTTAGKFYANSAHTYGAQQGFHYALVVPAGQFPTSGTISYVTAAATAPTIDDGSLSVGTATAKMTFQYAPGGRKIALELSVTMPGDATYTATTAGGLADPAQSPLGTFQASHFGDVAVTGAGAACAGASACKLSVRGFVGGGGADTGARVTLSYVIASGTIAKAIRGAVVLKPL